MKSARTSLPMLGRISVAATSCLFLLTARAQTPYGLNPADNPPPGPCCNCITITVNGTLMAGEEVGQPPASPKSKTGNLEVTIDVAVSEAIECEDVEVTKVYVYPVGEPGQATQLGATGGVAQIPATMVEKFGNEWEVRVECTGGVSGESGSAITEYYNGCVKRFELTGCSSCSSDGGSCEITATPTASQQGGVMRCDIPTTDSNGGTSSGSLVFRAPGFGEPNFQFPGRAGLFANVPSEFTVTRVGGLITQIDTGVATILVSDVTNEDAIRITHKDSSGQTFRTTKIAFVSEGGTDYLRMDSTFDSTITRFEQSTTGNGTFVLKEGFLIEAIYTPGGDPVDPQFRPLRQDRLTKTATPQGQRVYRQTIEERAKWTDAWSIVSDVETTWEGQLFSWVRTKEIIDPDTEALTSTWEYYQPGAITGLAGASNGLGRLKHHVRYDGYEEFHTYSLHSHTVATPYIADPAGRVRTSVWNPGQGTLTVESKVGGTTVSKRVSAFTDTTKTYSVFTAADATLVTEITHKPFGQDFGGMPTLVKNPDDTSATYTYTRESNSDGYRVVMDEGGSIGTGPDIDRGYRTTTVRNSWGTVIMRKKQSITPDAGGNPGIGGILDAMAVTTIDNLGRPTATAWYPDSITVLGETAAATNASWITDTDYSCCGIASETDRYGIRTFFAYDGLRRRTKTNRIGVTIETIRNGLSVETHRYAEAADTSLSPDLADNPDHRIGMTTSDVAGVLRASGAPNPTVDAPGSLLNTITTTTYQPAAGLSKSVEVRAPDNFKQTTTYFLDGRTATSTGVLSPEMSHAYSVSGVGEVTARSYLDGGTLRETETTTTDWAGRTVRIDYADGAFATMTYNAKGQLEKSTDPDGVVTRYGYNIRGERVFTAVDLDLANHDEIDFGTDNITFTETNGGQDGSGNPVWVTDTRVWRTTDQPYTPPGGIDGGTGGKTVSITERTPDGLSTTVTSVGVQEPTTTTIDLGTPDDGDWTVTVLNPDETFTLSTYVDGLLDTVEQKATNGTTISSTAMRTSGGAALSGYDTVNRVTHRTDSRTGTSLTTYRSLTADVVKMVTDPGGRETNFTYDVRSRRTVVDAPDTAIAGGTSDNVTTTIYNPDGTVQETTGDQAYRVTYEYDYADRMKSMTTYGTTTATTKWLYDGQRGWLSEKNYHGETDDGSTDADYTYTAAGRLATRVWERGVTTTYGYDHGGRLTSAEYSDATPDVSVTYDPINRPTSQSNGVATCAYAYDPTTLRLDTETVTYDWNLDQTADLVRVIDRSHDNLMRPAGFELKDGTTVEAAAAYTYGATDGRLATVTDGTDTFTYGYTPGSSLIATVTGPAHTVTNTWETTRDVLALKENEAGATLVSSYDYRMDVNNQGGVNDIGQRTSVNVDGIAFTGGQRDRTWTYDHLGQLVAEADANNTAFDRGFAFDAIGNRTASIKGDTDTSATGAVAYTPNALNQYTAVGSFTPAHDADGNAEDWQIWSAGLQPASSLTLQDAVFIWDAENRLIEIQDASSNTLAAYTYDSHSRRIRREVSTGVPGGPADIAYLYDGWNPIAEYDISTTPALSVVNLWGMDLSGSMQGAGGVGGLLSVTASSSTWYATYDGNGNVSEYLDSSGSITAHYEYDAFGNIVNYTESAAGVASTFRHRFSTKHQDGESGLLYYGYRWYDPVTGRWPSRDPIGERGGVNLYGFVGNDGVNWIDFLGLRTPEEARAKAKELGLREGDICKVTVFWGHKADVEAALEDFANQGFNGRFNGAGGGRATLASGLGCHVNHDAGTGIPGMPDCSKGKIGTKGTSKNAGLNPEKGDDDYSPDPATNSKAGYARLLTNAWRAAVEAGHALCEDCKCDSIDVMFECTSNIKTRSVNGLRDIEDRYQRIEDAVPSFNRNNPISSEDDGIPEFKLPQRCGSGIRIDCKTGKHTLIGEK